MATRRRARSVATILLGLSCFFLPGLFQSRSQPSVPGCPPNLVCFSVEEAKRIDIRLIDLEAKLARCELKARRKWGQCTGAGISLVPGESGAEVTLTHLWGYRW